MKQVIGIGETVLDIIFKNNQPTAAVPGGSTFNAITSLGRTVPRTIPDSRILMVTEIGDDKVGDIVLKHLRDSHVCTDAVTSVSNSQTNVSMAFLNEKNDATYEFFKDPKLTANKERISDRISFSGNDIVLFGSFFAIDPPRRDFIKGILQKAREAGAIIYYDINFRPSHRKDLSEVIGFIEENCRIADFVRGSSEDFQFIYGCSDGVEIYREHIAPLCPNLILTKGANPVEIITPEGHWEFPVPKVQTVSTIGAGDNFNAGFVYSLLAGGLKKEGLAQEDWRRMVLTATKFSSAVCRSVFNYVDENFEP